MTAAAKVLTDNWDAWGESLKNGQENIKQGKQVELEYYSALGNFKE
jgi:hypothetical protein